MFHSLVDAEDGESVEQFYRSTRAEKPAVSENDITKTITLLHCKKKYNNVSFCRHQIQHYTRQLATDTNVHLRDLSNLLANSVNSASPGEHRQRKMQKERLQDEFTTALNSFQVRITFIIFKQQVNHLTLFLFVNVIFV